MARSKKTCDVCNNRKVVEQGTPKKLKNGGTGFNWTLVPCPNCVKDVKSVDTENRTNV